MRTSLYLLGFTLGRVFLVFKLDIEDMLCYMPCFKIYGDPAVDFEWP